MNLPERVTDSHKNDYGHVFIIAGSMGMSGAATLAATAAMRTGAGLVTLFVPQEIHTVTASAMPEVMVLPTGHNADAIRTHINKRKMQKSAVVLGPGLGNSKETVAFIRKIALELELPLVLDADGLNAFAGSALDLTARAQPTILTPHTGEAKRLIGEFDDRITAAKKIASLSRAIVVLKGHESVITDGKTYHINTTGNAGMATAGSGDVLSGITGAILAQGLLPFEAARLATHLHGRAGDIASENFGMPSMIASDIIAALPEAIKEL